MNIPNYELAGSEYNIASKTMDRLGYLLQAIIDVSKEPYSEEKLDTLKELDQTLFNEVYAWLTPAEREAGLAFEHAILSQGMKDLGYGQVIIPKAFEHNLTLWLRWLYIKLKKHKLLSKTGEDIMDALE
jgi:hypothetical protein